MAMARQFFDSHNATSLGHSFSPAQIAPPIQDLVSRQLSIVPASRHSTPNFNGSWAETDRALSLPQSALSTASWASEFNSEGRTAGPIVHHSIQSPHLTGNAFGTVSSRFGLNFVPHNYRQGFEASSPVLDIKGKGKIQETDFDAAFAQVVSSLEIAPAKVEPTSRSIDPVDALEKDLNQAKLDDVPVVAPDEAIRQVEFKRFVAANASTATLTAYPL